MNDVDYERIIDTRVQARLRTDRAYNNAANAEEQSEREHEIEEQEIAALDARLARSR